MARLPPTPSLLDSVRRDVTADAAHVQICEMLERLAATPDGCVSDAEAVARGTMSGVAEWLALRIGPRASYDAFQRTADRIIENPPNPAGAIHGKAKGSEGTIR